MNVLFKYAWPIALLAGAAPSCAQVTFYEQATYEGRSFTTAKQVIDLQRQGFKALANSAVVQDYLWEVCDEALFSGRCIVLRPGKYPNLAAMGMRGRLQSVRRVQVSAKVDGNLYAPTPPVLIVSEKRSPGN